MAFPHWQNNISTQNHNHSSSASQLKLSVDSKCHLAKKKKKNKKSGNWVCSIQIIFLSVFSWICLPDEEIILYSTNCFLVGTWKPFRSNSTAKNMAGITQKSVVLHMMTEKTKSLLSPRINAPGGSKRQTPTNMVSITKTFSCTGRNTWF